jgi:hypothetical protein
MRIRASIFVLVLAVPLTGCGVTDLAKKAADATACKALSSTIKKLTDSYQSGIVDSGLITQIDSLIGDQARALLSDGLAQDLKSLTTALKNNNSATSADTEIQSLADSISKRCSDAGVSETGR